MEKQTQYTREGFEQLKEDLKALEKEIELNKKEIARARDFGDLSENSEYTEAKDKDRELDQKKRELTEMIKNAVVIDTVADASVIGIGSIVTVDDESAGKKGIVYRIVGSYEADPVHGKISDQSAVGAALMGKRAGATVEVELPTGKIRILKINDVRRAQEESHE